MLRRGLAEGTKKKRLGKEDMRKLVVAMCGENGRITVAQVAEAAGITKRTARAHLGRMVDEGLLASSGKTKDRVFYLGQ